MGIFKGQKNEITVPLTAKLDKDNGRHELVKFKARYRVLSKDEATDVGRRVSPDYDGGDPLTMDDIIRDTLVGWSDLEGEDGSEVQFSDENVDEALNIREYFLALAEGFRIAQYGKAAANAKN